MIIFLLTVSVVSFCWWSGCLYIGYKLRQFEDVQEVIFDAAVNAEERNREIELTKRQFSTPILDRIKFKIKII